MSGDILQMQALIEILFGNLLCPYDEKLFCQVHVDTLLLVLIDLIGKFSCGQIDCQITDLRIGILWSVRSLDNMIFIAFVILIHHIRKKCILKMCFQNL
jgi:hypothetical protein